ncbi:MAG: M48 family metallopeptidase [Pseudanabaenaceae cyanobacterium SKYGB_i_bin29]|nr:M48 family metallopeptidase [Pseudanabaenaceae cyanobacterium SKYG29]MDW8422007.1 M48 family metallopeptidase [Pseudanabaenaceae cyanobacterium SKYGB_i_bin29]
MLLDRPHPSNPPPSLRELLILFLGFITVIALVVWGLFSLLTALLVWLIPPQLEAQIGAAVIKEFERQAQPGLIQDKLNELQDRLEAKQASQERRDLKVIYIPEETVNAFAVPGDRIIIFRGLLDYVKSENELMMVLGHEIGHFRNRDHLRGIAQSLTWQIVFAVFFGDNSILQSIGSVTSAITQSSFSQRQELAADRVGLDLLVKVYGHAGGAVDFFARLAKAGKSPAVLTFLSTHPHPQARVKQLEQIIRRQRYSTQPVLPLPPQLQMSATNDRK